MYLWRKLTTKQRASLLAWRRQHRFPWHSPPHGIGGRGTYHLTAACLKHEPYIGYSPHRMADFCERLLAAIAPVTSGIHAWCVLPNHYHLLVTAGDLQSVTKALGKLHGQTSYLWNKEDDRRGRQVWHAAADRFMRGDRHFWATMNYIHLSAAQPQPNDRSEIKALVARSALCRAALNGADEVWISGRTVRRQNSRAIR